MSCDHELIFSCDFRRFAYEVIVHDNFCNLFACETNEMVMVIARNFIICIIGDHVFVNDIVLYEKAQFAKDRGTVWCKFVLFEM